MDHDYIIIDEWPKHWRDDMTLPTPHGLPLYLTYQEAADLLNLKSKDSVRRRVKTGLLQKGGGKYGRFIITASLFAAPAKEQEHAEEEVREETAKAQSKRGRVDNSRQARPAGRVDKSKQANAGKRQKKNPKNSAAARDTSRRRKAAGADQV